MHQTVVAITRFSFLLFTKLSRLNDSRLNPKSSLADQRPPFWEAIDAKLSRLNDSRLNPKSSLADQRPPFWEAIDALYESSSRHLGDEGVHVEY